MANEITLSAAVTATTPTAQISVSLSAIATQTGNIVVNHIQRIGTTGELLDFGDISGVPVLWYVENLSETATITLALNSGMTDTFATVAPLGCALVPPSAAAVYASAAVSAVTATAALTPTTVASIAVSAGGSGYTSPPTVTVVGGGSGAAATATVANYSVTKLTVTNTGSSYTAVPLVTFSGGGATATGAAALAILVGGKVTSYVITDGGTGYSSAPTVTITAGSGATATAVLAATTLNTITVTNRGSLYTTAPTVTITGGGGTGATATANLSGFGVASITITNAGSGYTQVPTVTFTGGGGSGAVATVVMNPSTVSSIAVTNPGSGYTSAPTVVITGGGAGASATAVLTSTSVQSVTVTASGSAFNKDPEVTFTGGGGTGAAATARRTGASVYSFTIVDRGSGYSSMPTFTFTGGGGTGARFGVDSDLLQGAVPAIYFADGRFAYEGTFVGGGANGGRGYLSAPILTITGGGGTGATAIVTLNTAGASTVGGVTMTAPGSGYTSVPTVSIVSNADGTGSNARFYTPLGTAVDSSGNVFVSEGNTASYTIRKVTSSGVVTTLAGTAGAQGSTDGTGAAARFNNPKGVATDGTNVYVADTGNHTIRKIVISSGVVTTLAGTAGVSGSTDATGAAARFNSPTSVATDGTNVYVADTFNHTIRKIVISSGVVTTLAGTAGVSGSTDATGAAARFNVPYGVAEDGTNVYVADGFYTVRQIVISSGVVTTLAGTYNTSGSTDDTGAAARFSGLRHLSDDGAGNLFVADNYVIRKIVIATGVVTTFAGAAGQAGTTDATGAAARFNAPAGVTVDGSGNLYVGDASNHTIRKITSGAVVTTFAGTAGLPGPVGSGATATASLTPTSVATVAVDTAGSGFMSQPTVVFSGGGGTGAAATASLVSTSIASLTVTNPGTGYTTVPTVVFTGNGTAAAGTAVASTQEVATISVTAAGTGFTSTPTVTINGGGGSGAVATANLTGAAVNTITLTAAGSGYRAVPAVTLAGGGGTGATATAAIVATTVGSISLSSVVNVDYQASLTLSLTGGGGTGATASPVFTAGALTGATVTAAGTGFTGVPAVALVAGVGVPVQVLAVET